MAGNGEDGDTPQFDDTAGIIGGDGDTWKDWFEENIIKWVAKDPYGFLYTVFMCLTPLFVISGILSWVLLKDIDKKDKEKKRKAKREANIAKARGHTRSNKPHPGSKKSD